MKRFLKILSIAALIFAVSGCNLIDSVKPQPSNKEFPSVSKAFTGYGLVNNWSKQDAQKYVNALIENNVDCMAFEFFEWSTPEKFAEVDTLIKKFETYVKLAKKQKILLYVTIMNSNIGSGKYGDPGIPSNKYTAQYQKAANALANWMKTNPNIYVTPCGEGGAQSKMAAHDKAFQQYCKSIMPKSQLVNNWGARPSSTDGMAFLCQHPSSVASALNSLSWIMSDHGLFIRELNGGDLYGTANYNVTFACTKKLLAKNKTFIYYHFNRNGSIDTVALKALKDAKL